MKKETKVNTSKATVKATVKKEAVTAMIKEIKSPKTRYPQLLIMKAVTLDNVTKEGFHDIWKEMELDVTFLREMETKTAEDSEYKFRHDILFLMNEPNEFFKKWFKQNHVIKASKFNEKEYNDKDVKVIQKWIAGMKEDKLETAPAK